MDKEFVDKIGYKKSSLGDMKNGIDIYDIALTMLRGLLAIYLILLLVIFVIL